MITYQYEQFDTLLRDAENLAAQHWEEVGSLRDARSLQIDVAAYRRLEQEKRLLCLGVRKDGALCGYVSMILGTDLHAASTVCATVDLVFVAPEQRKGRIGPNLLRYAELCAKHNGATVFHHRVKPQRDFSSLLQRQGFQLTETVYSKVL
jgi:GNAT superfamily N-acetyltransferase